MPDIKMDRKTYIVLSEGRDFLFPARDLFPAPDLYPVGIRNIDTIVAGSMTLEKMLLEDDFKFGRLFSDKFEVDLYGVEDLSNKYIYVSQRQEDGSYVSVFSGIVDSCKMDRLGTDRHIIAYDLAYVNRDVNVAPWWEQFWANRGWDPSTQSPKATLHELRNSLCAYLGLHFEDVVLPNDNIQIAKDLTLTSCSFGDMISMICELNCAFPHFDSEGYLRFIIFNTDANPVNVENNIEGENCTFEDYITIPMTGVNFYDSSDDLKQSIGNSSNAYIVEKNFLLYSADGATLNAVANVMLAYLAEFRFTPANLKMIVSDYNLDLGTYISTSRGNLYASQIRYSGSMLVEQQVESKGKEQMGESMGSTNFDSIITAERWHKVTNEVDRFESEMYEELNGEGGVYSRITQNTGLIETEVRRATGAEGTLSSRISQTASSVSIVVTKEGEDGASFVIKYTKEDGSVIEQTAQHIRFTGLVEFTDLSETGTTSINGANLQTGSISADKINVNGLVVNEALHAGSVEAENITGTTITGKTLSTGSVYSCDITGSSFYTTGSGDANLTLDNGCINFGTQGNSYIHNFDNAAGDALRIYASDVTSIESGNNLYLEAHSNIVIGDSTYKPNINLVGNVRVNGDYIATTGQIWGSLSIKGDYFNGTDAVKIRGFKSSEDDEYNADYVLITGTGMWSDRQLKREIENISNELIEVYNELEPKQFKYLPQYKQFNTNEDTVFYGFVAQDIYDVFVKHSLDSRSLVRGRYKHGKVDVKYLTLNYEYFHALHVKYAQHLNERINKLEEKNSELEQKNADLEARVARLEALIGGAE